MTTVELHPHSRRVKLGIGLKSRASARVNARVRVSIVLPTVRPAFVLVFYQTFSIARLVLLCIDSFILCSLPCYLLLF